MKTLSKAFLAVLLGAAIFSSLIINVTLAQDEIPEVTLVNPDTGDNTFTFSLGEVSAGTRFNVTAWVYNVTDLYAHQVYLMVNDTFLNITNAWLPTWDSQYIFSGLPTVGPAPTFYDDDGDGSHESCKVGDTILGLTSAEGSGLLAIIELEIISVPSTQLSLVLNINNTDTILLDSLLADIIFTKTDGVCSFEDTNPPVIDTPTQDPPSDNVQPDQEVNVMVNVTDDFTGVKNVTLLYTNDTEWYSIPMVYNETSGLWEATIPGFPEGTNVNYKIEAYDNAGNYAVNDNEGSYFVYTVIPELTLVAMLALFTILAIPIVAIAYRKKKLSAHI